MGRQKGAKEVWKEQKKAMLTSTAFGVKQNALVQH